MTTTTTSPGTRTSLTYLTHFGILGLWVAAGGVFSFTQLFAHGGLGTTLNYWLWFVGFGGLTTLVMRPVKSPVVVLLVHAVFAAVLNLIPTSMPWRMFRAGYDLLLNR